MQDLDIGKQWQAYFKYSGRIDCNQRDYLPFYCKSCQLFFCLDHRFDHACKDQDTNYIQEVPIKENANKCSLQECNSKSQIICKFCFQMICIKHRFHCQFANSEQPVVKQKQKVEAQHPIKLQPVEIKANQKPKSETVKKVERMKVRQKATGSQNIPQEIRISIKFELDPDDIQLQDQQMLQKFPIYRYFQDVTTIGRALDEVSNIAHLDPSKFFICLDNEQELLALATHLKLEEVKSCGFQDGDTLYLVTKAKIYQESSLNKGVEIIEQPRVQAIQNQCQVLNCQEKQEIQCQVCLQFVCLQHSSHCKNESLQSIEEQKQSEIAQTQQRQIKKLTKPEEQKLKIQRIQSKMKAQGIQSIPEIDRFTVKIELEERLKQLLQQQVVKKFPIYRFISKKFILGRIMDEVLSLVNLDPVQFNFAIYVQYEDQVEQTLQELDKNTNILELGIYNFCDGDTLILISKNKQITTR